MDQILDFMGAGLIGAILSGVAAIMLGLAAAVWIEVWRKFRD